MSECIVVKKIADSFWVKTPEGFFACKPMGKLKQGGVFVGDKVIVELVGEEKVITRVLERKNLLVRPPLANLDQLVIVVSAIPKPDWFIVDKLLLFSFSYGIKPLILVNKIDINLEAKKYVEDTYSSFVDVCFVSAKDKKNLDELKQHLKHKLSAFAGQSAVGKSALINAMFPEHKTIEGELSLKIERGKNTTRHTEIYTSEDIMIADTAGFTSLDETLLPIKYFELPFYYPDYLEPKKECKYSTCVHYKEPGKECKVKQLVSQGCLDRDRYERYRKIYEILNERWVKTHG